MPFVCDNKQETNTDIAGMKHITSFSSLLILLKYCLVCGVAATTEKLYTKGSVLCVNLLCKDGHKTCWSSQPKIKVTYMGNHLTTASIVFTGVTYAEFRSFGDILKLQIMSEKTFYKSTVKSGTSATMEKYGLMKVLHIYSYSHQLGVWHKSKNIKKKASKLDKNIACAELVTGMD